MPDTRTTPRKPNWLKTRPGFGAAYGRVRRTMRGDGLHTVCEEAHCPNQGQCWEHGRATIMILGDQCTRGCAFCGVNTSCGCAVDAEEPTRVAQAVTKMGLNEIVITSVTRDDLPDGGAAHWCATILALRDALPDLRIEVLVPDFQGNTRAWTSVFAAAPDVFAHNLETVPRLYSRIRPQADYARSLALLRAARDAGLIVKTGIMVGLGERDEEVRTVMRDAHHAGASVFTIGQYLQPSRRHAPVERYVEPAVFDAYHDAGRASGLDVVISGPLVRSSYHTEEQTRYVEQRLAARRAADGEHT